MAKKVRVGIEIDESFIRLLRANVELSDLKNKAELTPMQQLAIVVLYEARGGILKQVRDQIRREWEGSIDVHEDTRMVFEEDEQKA